MESSLKNLIEKADDKLYKLSDIEHVRNYDYSAPTFVQKHRFTARVPWTSSDMFRQELFKKYHLLKDIDLTNIAILGGCVIDILIKRSPSDIDMFIILDEEMSEAEANKFIEARARKLLNEIYSFMENFNERRKNAKKNTEDDDDINLDDDEYEKETKYNKKFYNLDSMMVQRYKNVFTVKAKCIPIPIQIVGTYYHKIEDLLRQTDIGCTSLCYYKDEVLFSAIGKFCYENLLFFVNEKRSGKSYSSRIIKYYDKGFDLVLPYLDISKVKTRNFKFGVSEVIDLPNLTAVINEIEKNKIFVSLLQLSEELKASSLPDRSELPGYSTTFSPYKSSSSNSSSFVHHNLHCIVKEQWDEFVFSGEGQLYHNAFLDIPLLTNRMIINSFETIRDSVFENGQLKFETLEKYFSIDSLSNIFNRLIIEYVKNAESNNSDSSNKMVKIFDEKYKKYVKDVMEDLTARQIEDINVKIEKIRNKEIVLKPIGKRFDDQVQHDCDAKQWYGEYLKVF